MYNPFSIEGKKILVTGASSGIGMTTAIECSKMGAKLVITGRNQDRLSKTLSLMEGDGHIMIVADLSNDGDINRLVDECPVLDGLVNNAGLNQIITTQFITREKLATIMDVNTTAPILLFQRLIKKKKLIKGGSVVFSSSISGNFCVGLGNVMYSTSKAAVTGFVKNAALDMASRGIRVNAVAPGMIETHILDNSKIGVEELDADKQRYPMKRYGRPEEVAYGIIYLLSDASSFTTGSSLVIDGGFTLQ